MKIIITYVSAGAGHRKAAEAIYSYFKTRLQDVDIRLVDVLQKSTPGFREFYLRSYSFLVNYALFLWAFGFWITGRKLFCGFFKRLNLFIDRLNLPALFSLLIQENPDLVISTHFLPSEIVACLKAEGKIQSRLITVVTDFGLHPFWIYPGTDTYAVAAQSTREKLKGYGIPPDNIRVTGIPIAPQFLKLYDRHQICAKLGIDAKKFTALVVTGSFGIGPIEAITDLLHNDVQMLVVCARNTKLYARLQAKQYLKVKIFGFVNNIEELMAASDLIITKPGGLGVSELLAMELAPIFICAIPGQESENAKTLAGCGIGLSLKEPAKIKAAILDYLHHPDKLSEIKGRIRSIKKPDAVKELYNVVCASSAGPADRRPL
jgi:processive 1,2-diacylglycerol beta-glucosyltransferase